MTVDTAALAISDISLDHLVTRSVAGWHQHHCSIRTCIQTIMSSDNNTTFIHSQNAMLYRSHFSSLRQTERQREKQRDREREREKERDRERGRKRERQRQRETERQRERGRRRERQRGREREREGERERERDRERCGVHV